jgi:hypothetical protein
MFSSMLGREVSEKPCFQAKTWCVTIKESGTCKIDVERHAHRLPVLAEWRQQYFQNKFLSKINQKHEEQEGS